MANFTFIKAKNITVTSVSDSSKGTDGFRKNRSANFALPSDVLEEFNAACDAACEETCTCDRMVITGDVSGPSSTVFRMSCSLCKTDDKTLKKSCVEQITLTSGAAQSLWTACSGSLANA